MRMSCRLARGLVAVTYDGCELQVAKGCSVTNAGYRYVPFNARKNEGLAIESVDELYAKLPLGAVRLAWGTS